MDHKSGNTPDQAENSEPGRETGWQQAHHWLRRRWRDLTHDPQRSRLYAAIVEMRCRIAAQSSAAAETPEAMLERVNCLLRRAEAAADRDDRFVAYDMLQCIERKLIELMSADERRDAFDARICESREKLSGWRKDFVECLGLRYGARCEGDDEEKHTQIPVTALRAVMVQLDQSSQNKQHKLELVSRRMTAAIVVTIVIVVSVLVAIQIPGIDPLTVFVEPPTTGELVRAGALLGLFGGLFSMLAQHAGHGDRKIPELRHALLLAAGRPAIGAAIAIPIVLLFQAGLFGGGEPALALILGACFAGGFSERWFIAQVEGLVGAGGAGRAGDRT